MKTLRFPFGVGCGAWLLCFVLGAAPGASAQNKDTVHIPVKFYDFRSDRSNPEFEQPHGTEGSSADQPSHYEEVDNNGRIVKRDARAHVRYNMVDSLLDKDGKPKTGKNPYLNYGVRFWFRDWSKLNTYAEQSTVENGRPYLTKFRPIYTYRDNSAYPPTLRQSANNAGISGGEWEARPQWKENSYETTNVTVGGRTYTVANAFENKVFDDYLVFRHVGRGVYEFDSARFFPLDGRGFEANGGTRDWSTAVDNGNEGVDNGKKNAVTDHNFAFTMEMVDTFTYVREDNLTFNFRGDDDVWVFINGKLAMDIGGIHNPYEASFSLNSMRQSHKLEEGKKYPIHMFYCERHSSGSSIRITTNIVGTKVKNLDIDLEADSVTAGDSVLARALIEVEVGREGWNIKDGTFAWTAKDLNPSQPNKTSDGTLWIRNPQGGANTTKSDSVYLGAKKAHTTIRLYVTYTDKDGQSVRDSADVYVKPGPAAKVWVENSPSSAGRLWKGMNMDTISISSNQTSNSSFYAILRDAYENWIGPAATGTEPVNQNKTITWKAADTAVAVAGVGASRADGQGLATRRGNSGSTKLTVTYTAPGLNNITPGTSLIYLDNVTYTAVQVGIKQGGPNGTFIPVSSSIDPNNKGTIKITVGKDTTLYVRMQRSDKPEVWDEVPAAWAIAGITATTTAPASSPSWNVTFDKAGTGTITASSTGAGSATVNIVVEWGDPKAAGFFYKSGAPVFTPVITSLQGTRPTDARMYAVPSATVTLVAGEPMPIVGMLFAGDPPSAANWLKDYAGGGKWSWGFVAGSPTVSASECAGCGLVENPTLRGGDSVTFKTIVAHKTYKIRGTFTQGSNITIQRDIYVEVIPDASKPVLVIEPNWTGKDVSPNAKQELDEIVFAKTDSAAQRSVFAVIRDIYGNYICPSGAENPYRLENDKRPTVPTEWSSLNPASVTAVGGYVPWGEGVVSRVGSIETQVVAYDSYWAVRDSVPVKFRDYGYNEIKIVAVCGSGENDFIVTIGGVNYCDVGDEITMTSNDDRQIFVVGERDDGGGWESVTGNWDRDGGLRDAFGTPPSGTNTWTLTPAGSGKGKITVTNGDKFDEVDVTITVGPPLYAELEILTPADEIRAGKEITARVKYYNRAGLMTEWNPGWTTPGAYFADTLGLGFTSKVPQVKSDKYGTQDLCYQGSECLPSSYINAKLTHSPTNLNDVVKFVIYYAADGHQVRYREAVSASKDPLSALSAKFTVLPGDASTIKIEGGDIVCDSTGCKLIVDQGDGDLVLRSVAYDEYGNRVGDYTSDWNSDKPIPVDVPGRPVIVYSPGRATENGCGTLTVVGSDNPKLTDTITICVTGVTERPISAITKDYDGCGFLDRIELKFKKPIYFTGKDEKTKVKPDKKTQIAVADAVNFKDGWTIDSVTVHPGINSVYIYLNDAGPHSATAKLQTGWTPMVNIYNGFFDDAGAQNVNTADGAAPVVETAKLYFPPDATGDVTKNYIEVRFSEKVRSSNGKAFGISQGTANTEFLPNVLFNIWEQGGQSKARMARTRALSKSAADVNAGKSFALSHDRLDGITKTIYKDDYTLQFYLENNKGVTPPNDYINIRTEDQPNYPVDRTNIQDAAPIVPLANNRKVPITYGNAPNSNMKAIPNPASPDPNRPGSPAGIINATHDENAIRDIRDGKYGGTVFEVTNIYVPETPGVNMRCQLKVYDLAGNLVISGESDKTKEELKEYAGQSTVMHLYWNGYNSKAMKVAPGTYRMVVYISYTGTAGKNLTEADKKGAKTKKLQGLVGMAK